MSKRPSTPLPDVSDAEFKDQLQPLAERVLPRKAPRVVKAPRQPMEFLLPDPVRREIKARAVQRGISNTTLLLEVLRDAGYPVTDADFIDMRKQTRKAS